MSSVTLLRMTVQLLILPVLARYLSPSDYGIVAMAMPFVLFAMMFSDAGISSSLMRGEHHSEEEWSTSFWLTSILGIVLAVILSLFGYTASIFLAEPQLALIIASLSLIVIFQAISSVPGAKLQQMNKFMHVAGIEIVAMTISLVAALFAALNGAGAWALVVQQIAQFLPRLVLTYIFSPFKPHMIFRLGSIHEHLVFGKNMLGINFINFLRQAFTNVLMGRIQGTANVGIFSMASTFSDLPSRIVSGPIQNVLYPRMSQLKDNTADVKAIFLFISKIISILIVPAIGMLAIAHAPVFKIVLSEKWGQAGVIFMLLSPSVVVLSVAALRNTIAMAYGKTDILMRQALEVSFIHIIALICTINFGIEWIAIGITTVTILYTPRSLYQIFSLIHLDMKDYLRAILLPIIFTIIAISVYAYIVHFDLSDWHKFGVAIVLGALTVAVSFGIQFKSLKSETLLLREILAKSFIS